MTSDTEKESNHATRPEDTQQNKCTAPTPLPPPNGGTQAWLVALGAFSALICTFGYLNSFG